MAHHDQDWDESNFEITSKRRRGFPSETQVKRGVRIVHGNKSPQRETGAKRRLPVRFRTQVSRTVACAPGVTTAVPGITFFRE